MPSDQAALKLIYLAIRHATEKGHRVTHRFWHQARLQFAIYFEDRFTEKCSQA